MYRIVLALLLVALLSPFADARGRTSSSKTTFTHNVTTHTSKPKAAPATKCTSCARNSKGRIARSATAKHTFQKSHPCPSTGKATGACPGYVIDHVQPLKRGGADAPGNMQWQTKAAAKAKDKME
jgi:hypothetical protein